MIIAPPLRPVRGLERLFRPPFNEFETSGWRCWIEQQTKLLVDKTKELQAGVEATSEEFATAAAAAVARFWTPPNLPTLVAGERTDAHRRAHVDPLNFTRALVWREGITLSPRVDTIGDGRFKRLDHFGRPTNVGVTVTLAVRGDASILCLLPPSLPKDLAATIATLKGGLLDNEIQFSLPHPWGLGDVERTRNDIALAITYLHRDLAAVRPAEWIVKAWKTPAAKAQATGWKSHAAK